MAIGDNIKKLRKFHDLSQKDLALIAGVSDKAVSTWESGAKEPRMGVIQKIADHFGLQKSNIIEDNGLDNIYQMHDNGRVNTVFQSKLANSLPALNPRDERSIKKKLESVLNDLMPENALAYYDGDEPMSDEDKELLRISLENTMRLAKQMAKQKFTPNKFKK
ncbi:helix-turn-helix transcriptional regulator [Pelosinus propionicus]|uniref:DNA-binding transcriptional regulator, XRE-family HTH domain n=1 Tax=Pelosinus propionicus DSM 13327 TaxID=1123291 RepID=A0A1I4NFT0_9FIRM|nr:helix-turn-helix transcriptional regulator [Pelosinus propionicus]SFM14329.1 DNA-binding transcriptional regulator, XRE-family HTH domain [Pelosinus propionicus DSM 13327]